MCNMLFAPETTEQLISGVSVVHPRTLFRIVFQLFVDFCQHAEAAGTDEPLPFCLVTQVFTHSLQLAKSQAAQAACEKNFRYART